MTMNLHATHASHHAFVHKTPWEEEKKTTTTMCNIGTLKENKSKLKPTTTTKMCILGPPLS
jgi:hypothetical protein